MPASGADREPHGDFAGARASPAQEEVGDIGAGDDQHQGGNAHQHQRQFGIRRRLGMTHLNFGQQLDAMLPVGIGMLFL